MNLNLRAFINKFKEIFSPPSLEISKERERQIADKVVNFVSRTDLETPAWIFIQGLTPVNRIMTTTFILPMAPVLEFFGLNIYEYIAFINRKENLEQLLQRIGETEKAKMERRRDRRKREKSK